MYVPVGWEQKTLLHHCRGPIEAYGDVNSLNDKLGGHKKSHVAHELAIPTLVDIQMN